MSFADFSEAIFTRTSRKNTLGPVMRKSSALVIHRCLLDCTGVVGKRFPPKEAACSQYQSGIHSLTRCPPHTGAGLVSEPPMGLHRQLREAPQHWGPPHRKTTTLQALPSLFKPQQLPSLPATTFLVFFFFLLRQKTPKESNLRKKSFFQLPIPGDNPLYWGSPGSRNCDDKHMPCL